MRAVVECKFIDIIKVFPHALQLKGFSLAAAASDGFHQLLDIKISLTFALILRVKLYGWKGHAPSPFFAGYVNWRNFVLNLVMNFF
jgi:hypothetical protein